MRDPNQTYTVGHLYKAVSENIMGSGLLLGPGSGEFDTYMADLGKLSEVIYFSRYRNPGNVANEILTLYLAYQVLLKAATNSPFRARRLSKVLNLNAGNNAFINNIGVADLLVVKQHILRYEATEIAHIENVMKGETRKREHRFLDRFEETLLFENEKTTETEKESETTERFEMNRETSKTIQEDQKFSADLSTSGKYGPTTVTTNMAFSMDVSETNEINTSSEYAKDITDRSLEKVTERVRTERITKIVKENETTNLHSFTNVPSEVTPTDEVTHVSGIYQFVDKIYQAQVFNYGKRQMFELMIPEPASYLDYLGKRGSSSLESALQVPDKLEFNPFDIESVPRSSVISGEGNVVDSLHYTDLATKYRATGINPPPTDRVATFHYSMPRQDQVTADTGMPEIAHEGGDTDAGGGSHEAGVYFYPPTVLDITIPEKYIARKIDVSIMAYTDVADRVVFTFNVGSRVEKTVSIANNTLVRVKEFEDNNPTRWFYKGTASLLSSDTETDSSEGNTDNALVDKENKLKITYFSKETANHSLSFDVLCRPSQELIEEWQLATYIIIENAYQDRLLEYESKIAQFNADQKAQERLEKASYGVPPSKQKQIMLTEIKKHAVSIVTNNHMLSPGFTNNYPLIGEDATGSAGDGDGQEVPPPPPTIDRQKAKLQGDFIRFFEQAFEWSQMQYAFYPYFWSKQERWNDKFKLDDPNYEYQQFLQASAARLILPVRPGFEAAVAHYMETEGEEGIWSGDGSPDIDSPLYVSIVDEIREQSGNTEREPVPVGEPWEIRLPTSHIMLKKEEALPEWEERDGEIWEWVIKKPVISP
jgi:hypothetical protein